MYLTFDMSETYNVSTNKSNLTFSNFKIKAVNSSGANTSYVGGTIKVTANGTEYTIFSATASAGTYKVTANGSFNTVLVNSSNAAWSYTLSDLTHNSSGALSISVAWAGITLNNYYSGFGISISGSETVALTSPGNYTLTLNKGAGTNLVVDLYSSPFRSTFSGFSSNSTIYEGEVIRVFGSVASEGYENFVLNVSSVGNVSTGTTCTVTGNITVKTTADVKSYSLSITADSNSAVTVNRTSSPLKGATIGDLINGATIYYNDVILIEFSASMGYELKTSTVNDENFTSGDSHTVIDNVTIVAVSKPSGVIYVDDGIAIEKYLVYVDKGSRWDRYVPYIDNGSTWNICG